MTTEKLPPPFCCIAKDLRLVSGFCHSILLLAKYAGNRGTTNNAEWLKTRKGKRRGERANSSSIQF